MRDPNLSRRRFLTLTGGAALAAGAGGLLAGCGSTEVAGPKGPATAKLPDYIPSQLVKPDLPASADGLMAGYYQYPRRLVDAYRAKPGAGAGNVSILTNMFNPVPPAAGSNAFWQELNTRVGATLDITMTPSADYLNKLSTVIAGGDLPDMMLISARLTRRADVLTRLCADLSDLVSGSAIKDFPSLANIPTDSWQATAFSSGVYAIPIPRAVVGTIPFSRVDLIRQRGLNPEPGNYQDFLQLARGLTDPRANRWAFGNPKRVIEFVGNMLGVPNLWQEQGGKFVSEFETEQRKQAIARATEMYKEGLFHPDSVGGKLNLRELFGKGTVAIIAEGYAAWDTLATTYSVEVGGMVAPGYDGGAGTSRAGTAIFALTAFKKTNADRLRQLLGICDWLAAPIGTSEYMFRRFGVEGQHYTWQGDVPVRTGLGNTEVKLPLEYIAEAPHVLGPGDRSRVDAQRAYQEKVVPRIVRNPAESLYSDVALDKAGELSKIIDNAELDIVSGRKPLDHWDEAVTAWRRAGGDQMRADYEAARAKQG
ncbi:extracellular solute-binding protein [Micromonospora krabiensis]|uniref:Putative aldouronate transport system substrate-binding protein n=1 Tax=Micromonospora krabiensis TaxID=307121 RepID=A0A1C3MY20_9ACTN|nr:extracellular solute-binding protein [Micromonospora krabiensis]SBV25215.1 putative aldouronate transport system substrate-binding protein [Micromonospora krabiensis]